MPKYTNPHAKREITIHSRTGSKSYGITIKPNDTADIPQEFIDNLKGAAKAHFGSLVKVPVEPKPQPAAAPQGSATAADDRGGGPQVTPTGEPATTIPASTPGAMTEETPEQPLLAEHRAPPPGRRR